MGLVQTDVMVFDPQGRFAGGWNAPVHVIVTDWFCQAASIETIIPPEEVSVSLVDYLVVQGEKEIVSQWFL